MFNQQQQPAKPPSFKFVIKSKMDTLNPSLDATQKEETASSNDAATASAAATALDDSKKRKRPLSEAPVTKRKVSFLFCEYYPT